MRKNTRSTLLLILLVAGVSGYFILKPESLQVPTPAVAHGSPPKVTATTSDLQIEFLVKLSALEEAINNKAPKRFSGERSDPTDALSEDNLTWHLSLGKISLSSNEGFVAFSAPFSGQATVRGKFGVKQRNSGLLGQIEGTFNKSVRETAEFSGVIRGTLKPTFNPDWTIEPNLKATVDVNKAQAKLFNMIKLSFRGEIDDNVQKKVKDFVTGLNKQIATDSTIRSEVQKGWSALHLSTAIYKSPPIWISLAPQSVGASLPEVKADKLILRVDATVKTGMQIGAEAPRISVGDLPELGPASKSGNAFSLAVPVALDLHTFQAVPPADLKLPDSFETPAGKVRVKRLFLTGDAGVVYLGADVTAREGWLKSVSGTIYLAGKPVLDKEGHTLRMNDLKYDVRTSNELVKTANFLLHPTILAELRKLAVFDIKSSKKDLMGVANAEIAKLAAQLPPGVELDFSVKDLGVAEIVVDDGWLVAVATASGPASVSISGLGGLLGDGSQKPAKPTAIRSP